MKAASFSGIIFFAFILLQNLAALWGLKDPTSTVEATLSIMADRLIPEEYLVAAVSNVLDAGEFVEVLYLEEVGSTSQQEQDSQRNSQLTRRQGGRSLLFAPATAPAEPSLTDNIPAALLAAEQGTGQKVDTTQAADRLFTTAAFSSGDSILSHIGFGLQRSPQQSQLQQNGGASLSSDLQQPASLLQAESVPGSTRLWDASVAEAQRRGAPIASLYPDESVAQSPGAGQSSLRTGFGLERTPQRSSSTDEPLLTDEGLDFPDAPSAAVPVRTLSQGLAAAGPSGAQTSHSLISQIGIGLEKPPADGGRASEAVFDAALESVPESKPAGAVSAAAAASGGAPGSGSSIDSLQKEQYTAQKLQNSVQAASVMSAAATAGAPPLSARRRGLAAWGESAAEVKDDGWAREGWQGSAKTGDASSGAGRGTHRLKVGAGMDMSKTSSERALGDSRKGQTMRGQGAGSQRNGAALHKLPAKGSQALLDSSANGGDDISDDVDTAEQGRMGVRGGRGLPLVAKSGAAKHGSQSGKKTRRRPFRPKNDQYILDALEADIEDMQSQLQGDRENENGQMDIIEAVTGYKQVPRDPRELDVGLLSNRDEGDNMQAGGGKTAGRGSGKGSGSQGLVMESGSYVTQIAAIRVKTSDPKFLERLKSHRLLAKLKQTFLDLGIQVGDVAVIPKLQGRQVANGAVSQGSAAGMEGAKTKRGLLAASGQVPRKLPVSLVSAIQAAAGFVALQRPTNVQAEGVVTTH
ncbi:hypothetical protein COCOBI_11-4440 [Coccomyxa sp. Obi]|nr:hypothetical protein COCOBI_11-4440 [Coccomyxa sp. Obi]